MAAGRKGLAAKKKKKKRQSILGPKVLTGQLRREEDGESRQREKTGEGKTEKGRKAHRKRK